MTDWHETLGQSFAGFDWLKFYFFSAGQRKFSYSFIYSLPSDYAVKAERPTL